MNNDLIEKCLRVWHGDGAYGWDLVKNQWPEAAIDGQRRKMGEVILVAQSGTVRTDLRRSVTFRTPEVEEVLRAQAARISRLEWIVGLLEERMRRVEGDAGDWQALADWYEDRRPSAPKAAADV